MTPTAKTTIAAATFVLLLAVGAAAQEAGPPAVATSPTPRRASDRAAHEEKVAFGRFGTVTLYHRTPHPSSVVLFISGDGGWNLGVVDMARELATLDALVVGIDITHYMKELEASNEHCVYPAADLEALSQFIQKKLDFPDYITPVLVGYSSGATLVYAVLVQAPPGTFLGGISLGFCPDLQLDRPMCRGYGIEWTRGAKGKGVVFLPATTLEVPWIALQGTIDQVCDPPATERYVASVPHGEVVVLPKVGHGFSVPRNWMPQFRQAFARLLASSSTPAATVPAPPGATPQPFAPTTGRAGAGPGAPPPSGPTPASPASPGGVGAAIPDVTDLPLVEVAPAMPARHTLAVILSGDGGWASIDRQLGTALAADGVNVVGLNSLKYFWHPRTPDGTAADLARVIRHYLAAWDCRAVLLIGYSRGADVLPFLVHRLPADLLASVRLVALLGLEPSVAFEFHVGDWLGGGDSDELPVRPEVERLSGLRVMCVYGEEEKDSLCPKLPPGLVEVVKLPGAHHFGGDYQAIASRILDESR
jgi:type IV secretory pathway VirJ component